MFKEQIIIWKIPEVLPPPPITTTEGYAENTALYLGNPSGATVSTENEENYLMEKSTYALSYNNITHNPNWVSWHLCADDLGDVTRSDKRSGGAGFQPDTSLPSGWYQVVTDDYTGSGYTRGHMVPSSDRTSTEDANDEVFLMTNMVPQITENNNTVWEGLESQEVSWVENGKELYIICGPYYNPEETNYLSSTKTSTSDIQIPSSTWRVEIILDTTSDNDLNRITTETTVIAINVPNVSTCYSNASSNGYSAKTSWKYYICTIDEIEELTGYDFFANLPDEIENALEAKIYSE